jgi:glycosyltransferase involved in cell wall biosynthesis
MAEIDTSPIQAESGPMPQVSLVIPVYNRSSLLERALQSVQQQTSKDFEVIVVDDHSTNDILAVVEGFGFSCIKTNGKGVSAARNTGIRSTQSEFIAFLDSDDEWHPTKLEKQLQYLSLHPELSMVHTNEVWMRDGQQVKQSQKHQKSGGRIFSQCTQLCLIAPSSVLAHRSLFDEVGLFDESFPVCEDFDLWLRMTALQDIGFLSEPLVIKHAGHNDQLSMQYHSMDLWRVRALSKHLNHPHLSEIEHLALRSSLKTKCEILLKGFEKHQNLENVSEVMGYVQLLNK